ncbi:MFS transporter [Streptomyces sp. NBC_01210]|uniref:MFS transporter n=1 Tax=Streptomyces sp. NBC_01210 TaxID=2903774 RepID=UPI002E15C3A8|nr:MFS transporter [Streptomyces sp. NBC_01210]
MPYRELATRPVLTWSLVAVGARSPIAMAPLALVFLVRERPGGYGLGATHAAVYVLGEILGALLLGPRLTPERARFQIAAGLVAGAAAFAALGVFPHEHPVLLGAFALTAGAAPAASPGGLRTMLLSLVPERAAAQAMSFEATLTFVIWAATPALATSLALGVNPSVPLLLAAGLAVSGAAGLWALPVGWQAEEAPADGGSTLRVLAAAWPVFVTGAAAMGLLALAELVLPALLEQRHIAVGWAGPLLAGYSVAAALGSFGYGLRTWPGRVRTQSLVLLFAVSAVVAAVALVPALVGVAVGLLLAGVLTSGVQLTRTLALRQALPARTLAAGFSVMYAAAGVGYAASATLSGALLSVASPSAAILAGVGLTVVLAVVSALGERRMSSATEAAVVQDSRAESAAVDGRRDAEHRL